MTTTPSQPWSATDRRVFLGWDRPLLHLLAASLLEGARRHPASGLVDLADTVVVLPGTRAGRRLTELLLRPDGWSPATGVRRADPAGLLPPTITTIHGLWDVMTAAPVARSAEVSATRIATPLQQRLAWASALRAAPHRLLTALVPAAPASGDLSAWLALADLLVGVRAELAGYSIALCDIPGLSGATGEFSDAARWQAASQVEGLYLELLERAGLVDPELHREACLTRGTIRTGRRVILAGVTDLNGAARRLVDALGGACTFAVFAPRELEARFDQHGCVVPDAWELAPIEIADSRIRIVAGPSEQALAALQAVADWAGRSGRPAADQVTIGVPDAEVAERLCLLGNRATDAPGRVVRSHELFPELRLRSASGTPIMRTAPLRLLAAATEFLQSRTFESFSTLVSHPDLESWLMACSPASIPAMKSSCLAILDQYQSQHLHWIVDGCWQTKDEPARSILEYVHAQIAELLGPLLLPSGVEPSPLAEQPLSRWAEAIWSFVSAVYSDTPGSPEHAPAGAPEGHSVAACSCLFDALSALRSLPGCVGEGLSCTAPAAIRILCSMVASTSIPDEVRESAIELLGWLELPLDDAPALVITGMNEGVVPGPDGIDPLLPASIRARLGLPSARHRAARDAWSLSAILASRPDAVLISARLNSRGDPLAPSRLLLAAGGEAVASRILRWAGEEAQVPHRPLPGAELNGTGGLDRPTLRTSAAGSPSPIGFARRPTPIPAAITTMSVTSFREYIDSPYGYYLKYVARLAEVEARPLELDGMLFGNLIHDVLRKMQAADLASSTHPGDIADFLMANLTAIASQSFGEEPMPAVSLQLGQARERLLAFARWQAEWAAQGWRIHRTEWSPDAGAASLEVDGAPMYLSGRIDRVDVNESTGQVAILDYKTGDNAPDITGVLSRRKQWRDLQLPLYRHLVRPLAVARVPRAALRLGYIAIPRNPSHTGASLANWTEEDLALADERAAGIIRNIRQGNFSELGANPPRSGILANICGTTYRSLAVEDSETADDETEEAP